MGRSPYDYESHGILNLRAYVRQFELPSPDPASEKDLLFMLSSVRPQIPATNVNKSHKNHLLTQHAKWRTFENIRPIMLTDKALSDWTVKELAPKASEELNLQTDPRYALPNSLPPLHSHAPMKVDDMAPWLSLLLITATRIIHSTMPRTQQFSFQHGIDNSKDRDLFRHFIWSYNGQRPHIPLWDSGSVVVAYQPPFILTYQDLSEFVECKAFPTFDVLGAHLSSKHRLWAKIWDTCQATQCNWFVLTTYTYWVFGAFSRGMRVAFVSPIITYNKSNPTILQYSIFWLCSAMHLPGTLSLPQVDEPVFAEYDIDMVPVTNVPRPPNSASFWSGKDDEPASSAGVDLTSRFDGEGSVASDYPAPERPDFGTTKGEIRAWLATCQAAKHRVLDEDDLVPYIAYPESRLSDTTAEQRQGEWMIPTLS